jgi:hypothetical protein
VGAGLRELRAGDPDAAAARTVVNPTPPRPPVSAPRDQTAPVLSRARLSTSTSTSRVARSGATITCKAGAKLSFDLSEASVVTVTVLKLKGKRYKALSPQVPLVESAGAVSRKFSGRLGGKALKTGGYKLRLAAVETAGNAGRPVTVAFRIVR